MNKAVFTGNKTHAGQLAMTIIDPTMSYNYHSNAHGHINGGWDN